MPSAEAALRAQALRWLAAREHSRQELRLKLWHWSRRLAAGEAAGEAAVLATREATGQITLPPAGRDAPGAPSECAEALEAAGTELGRGLDQLLDTLQANGWLSDERFISSRVRLRQNRFGNRRIEYELKQHGLKLPQEAAQVLQRTERLRAQEVLAQRFGSFNGEPLGVREWQRRQRFLAARGFGAETIQEALKADPDS